MVEKIIILIEIIRKNKLNLHKNVPEIATEATTLSLTPITY
jgi:hypothetical protein